MCVFLAHLVRPGGGAHVTPQDVFLRLFFGEHSLPRLLPGGWKLVEVRSQRTGTADTRRFEMAMRSADAEATAFVEPAIADERYVASSHGLGLGLYGANDADGLSTALDAMADIIERGAVRLGESRVNKLFALRRSGQSRTAEGLDESQLLHFQAFGFVILRQMFTPEETATIRAEQDRAIEEAITTGEIGEQLVSTMGASTPFLAAWLEDPRFVAIARQVMGQDVLGCTSYAMRYVGDTGWHSDDYSSEVPGVKMVTYCAPMRAGTGALRVVPATHKIPLEDRLRDTFAKDIQSVPAYVCETDPGDVIVFDNRIWHASCGGSNDRRACYLYFLRNPHTDEEIAAAREMVALVRRMRKRYGSPFEAPRSWIEGAANKPVRHRWIERMRELGWLDAE